MRIGNALHFGMSGRMHRSPERQIGLICARSSAKIAKGMTAPNGGSARVTQASGDHRT
jgi:hypothetical protein